MAKQTAEDFKHKRLAKITATMLGIEDHGIASSAGMMAFSCCTSTVPPSGARFHASWGVAPDCALMPEEGVLTTEPINVDSTPDSVQISPLPAHVVYDVICSKHFGL